MKRCLLLSFFCLTIITRPCFSQSADSVKKHDTITTQTRTTQQDTVDPDEEFNVFLFGLFFGTMAVTMIVAVIGIILVGFVILGLMALVAWGIVSVAALRGWYKKSVGSAVRTAIYLIGMIGGAVVGLALSWLIQFIWKWSSNAATVWLTGSISGAAGGIVAAITGIWLVRKAWAYMLTKVRRGFP
jgi:hypothetical protein